MSTNYAAADRPRKLPTEIRGVAWTRTRRTKVTSLTDSNVAALREALKEPEFYMEALTKTTATFYGTPAEALAQLADVRATMVWRFGSRGHPVASLPAVRRKLETEAKLRP